MKKPALFLFCTLQGLNLCFGQKFGYIDTQLILSKMPEFAKAQNEINQISVKEQQRIEELFKEADKLRREYQKEEVLLTDAMKKERTDSINAKENIALQEQKRVFGFNGLIFLKRQELIRPLQDKIADAAGKVARKKKLQFIFDKANDPVMIYADPTHDYTDYVLETLGLTENTNTESQK